MELSYTGTAVSTGTAGGFELAHAAHATVDVGIDLALSDGFTDACIRSTARAAAKSKKS